MSYNLKLKFTIDSILFYNKFDIIFQSSADIEKETYEDACFGELAIFFLWHNDLKIRTFKFA